MFLPLEHIFYRFNTQPPEGGWTSIFLLVRIIFSFNTQPPEGGWDFVKAFDATTKVSTHSRLKAAGCNDGFSNR